MKYKFRGKGIANNKWYYGDLIIVNDTDKSKHYYIIADEYSDEDGNIPNTIKLDTCNSPEVIPETVGQYTGLHAKNGKEIYKGDIVKIPLDYEKYGTNAGEVYEVYFAYGGFRLKPKYRLKSKGYWLEDDNELEVIGNTTDNPELLKEE